MDLHSRLCRKTKKIATKNETPNLRGWSPSAAQIQASSRQNESYSQASHNDSYAQNAQPRRSEYPTIDVAGGANDYTETKYRYANKSLQQQQPLAQGQYYGIKALKNLSGVKLY